MTPDLSTRNAIIDSPFISSNLLVTAASPTD